MFSIKRTSPEVFRVFVSWTLAYAGNVQSKVKKVESTLLCCIFYEDFKIKLGPLKNRNLLYFHHLPYLENKNSPSLDSTCLGHLGWHDTDRIVSISCCAAQGGQGNYCIVLLSLALSHILRLWKHNFMNSKFTFSDTKYHGPCRHVQLWSNKLGRLTFIFKALLA
jgi:hypothetical protein